MRVVIISAMWIAAFNFQLARASQAGDVQLPPIPVVGHYDNAIGTSDAASQGQVTARLIENRPLLRPGEVLEFVPGLIVTQHSGDGKANQYFLRGFNLDHGTDFAVYLDEIPVNMRTHAHGQGYTDLNFLIPELLSHIHYRKGPYFAEEGDFGSAGAAHVHQVNVLQQGMASATIGSHGYQRYLLANSSPMTSGNLLYALEINQNNGPWESPEQLRKLNALLRYSEGSHADGFSVTAMAYRNRWNASDQIPMRAVEAGQLGRFGALDPTDGGNSQRYSLSFTRRQRGADSLVEMSAYALQSRLSLYSNFTYAMGNPTGGDQFNQREQRKMIGVNLAKTWFSRFGNADTQNKFGLQSRYDQIDPIGLYSTEARQQTAVTREDKVKEGSIGIYAENATQWFDWFRTVAGLRYDRYHFGVTSNLAANSGKVSASITSPKLSLIFGPWHNTEYFINAGKGFHSNDARGTTQTQLPSGGPSAPVTPLVGTRGNELGMRTEIIPGLQSSVALWQLYIDSELIFVGDAGETEASRASKRHGIEWNNHYVVRPWLLFDLDIAASKARYRDDDPAGKFIPGAIDKVISFGATITDLGPWSGALQIRYFGPRPLIEDNSVRSASTTVANTRVAYRIDSKTRLNVDVFNLFNRKSSDIEYLYSSQLRGETTSVSDIHFHPVEPRTVRIGLIYNF